jgi:hypothetical protein
MADSDPRVDPASTGTPGPPPARPRWVKTFAIVAGIVIVIVIVVMIISGGEHGPGRHLPGGDDREGHAPPVQHSRGPTTS